MTQQATLQIDNTGLTLERLYQILVTIVKNDETKMNGSIKTLEDKESDIGEADMLVLQSKLAAWSNISSVASGLLRAVADAFKATTQNIR
jgi:hypothetical protein